MRDAKCSWRIRLRSMLGVIALGILFALPGACNKDKGAGGSSQNVKGPGGNNHSTSSSTPAGSGVQTVDSRMRDFFQKAPSAPLTKAQLESLGGTWEARYVSFELAQAPVDVASLGVLQFKIEKTDGGVVMRSLDERMPSRLLTVDGDRIRAAKIPGKPALSFRIDGNELAGEFTDKDLHAVIRGVRK